MAAAFNAPIGGVLFALEEVSTHWSPRLTGRSFFAAIIAAVTMSYCVSGRKHGVIEDDALVVFGQYDLFSVFKISQLPIFVAMGACGGVLGALFNNLNSRLNRWRQRALSPGGAMVALTGGSKARAKVLEACFLAAVCATVSFFLPLLFGCSSASSTLRGDEHAARSGGRLFDVHSLLVPVKCRGAGEYNEIASITLSDQHRVVRALFSRHAAGALFSTRTLAICLVVNFALSVLVYGVSVPSGLFIPCMTIGALGGRLIGEVIAQSDSVATAAAAVAANVTMAETRGAAGAAAHATAAAALATADTGFYALVGAAAMLGGVTRMTISLTVIICEISNDAGALIPLMATILTAKAVGDLFNPSIYDAAIALAGFPYLDHEPPRGLPQLRAVDFMASNVVALPAVVRARDAMALLTRTTHGAFPVIDRGQSGQCKYLAGMIHRYALQVLLRQRCFVPRPVAWAHAPDETCRPSAGAPQGPATAQNAWAMGSKSLGALPLPGTGSKAPRRRPEPPRRRRAGLGPGQTPASGTVDLHALVQARRDLLSGDDCAGGWDTAATQAQGEEVALSVEEGDQLIDLRGVMELAPLSVPAGTPLGRVHQVFTAMGLRHLFVTDSRNQLLGVITRKDLLPEVLAANLDDADGVGAEEPAGAEDRGAACLGGNDLVAQAETGPEPGGPSDDARARDPEPFPALLVDVGKGPRDL